MSRMVRRATPEEVAEIGRLVKHYARRGDLLPRSEGDIRASLDDWLVAEEDSSIIGVGSLVPYSHHLVELRSLAVVPGHQGRGVGRGLVEELARRAEECGYEELFALTRELDFFARCGFREAGMERFPQKVWRDCCLCPLRDRCNETPMVRLLRVPAGLTELSGVDIGGRDAER